MTRKIATITLRYIDVHAPFSGEPAWRVEKVTDSIDYHPGQTLTKSTVDGLCSSRWWKVTIIAA